MVPAFFVADILTLTEVFLLLLYDCFLVRWSSFEHVSGLVQCILFQIPVLLAFLIILCDVVATRFDFEEVFFNGLQLCLCLLQLLLGFSESLLCLSKLQLIFCKAFLQGCLLFLEVFHGILELVLCVVLSLMGLCLLFVAFLFDEFQRLDNICSLIALTFVFFVPSGWDLSSMNFITLWLVLQKAGCLLKF